jgi:hypothetical protein
MPCNSRFEQRNPGDRSREDSQNPGEDTGRDKMEGKRLESHRCRVEHVCILEKTVRFNISHVAKQDLQFNLQNRQNYKIRLATLPISQLITKNKSTCKLNKWYLTHLLSSTSLGRHCASEMLQCPCQVLTTSSFRIAPLQ